MKTWPTLYKITSTGAKQEWTVEVEGDKYRTRFGQTKGTITTSEWVTCNGKRGNSDDEQAIFEAQALWEKKLKKDYTENKDVVAGEKSHLIEGGILPMLAHKFSEHGDKLVYPCFVQPKLDGSRCIGQVDGTLWTRTRKQITGLPHVAAAVKECLSSWELDGELYAHQHCQQFEQIMHLVRSATPAEGHEAVEYHVYDVAQPRLGFRDRWEYICEILGPKGTGPITLVETREVANEDELMLAFEDFMAQGYEGAIARNANGVYVNKRSYDLLKIKKFDDAEFWCVAVEEGKGKMAGHAIFVCKNASGSALFKAKMKGDHLSLVKYFEHPELVVNKLVTVKYQGLTNKNGVPRFPVALRIREEH